MHAQQYIFGNQTHNWSCDFLFISNLPFLTRISGCATQFSRNYISVIPKEGILIEHTNTFAMLGV